MIKNEEKRREYYRSKNKGNIFLRLTPEEKTLLEDEMNRQGWEVTNRFIRYKLFGWDVDSRVDDLVQSKDPSSLAILLRNQVFELTQQYLYVSYRYDKDMAQLYKEEGVDLDKWTKATNRNIAGLKEATQELLTKIRRIANALGLEDYTRMPSDEMHLDAENPNPAQMDALATQLRKERIAMGFDDPFKD